MSAQQRPAGASGAAGTTTPEVPATGGPMVRRILLGSQLRRLREARGVTRGQAGYSIRASESKISRMELGRVRFKQRDVADLLTFYGVTDDAEREPLLGLARTANHAGWWHSYNDVLPSWFQTYVGLEAAAERICAYEVQFVHGLLQCESYAHAVVVRGSRGRLPLQEADRRVALRMNRQRILFADNAPHLHCVLDETALHRPYGSRDVMDQQLRTLLELSERPNITVLVVPLVHGGHVGESGAFTMLRFAQRELSDVVYVEQLTGALYLDKEEEVAAYQAVLDELCHIAGTPEAGRDLLHHIRKTL